MLGRVVIGYVGCEGRGRDAVGVCAGRVGGTISLAVCSGKVKVPDSRVDEMFGGKFAKGGNHMGCGSANVKLCLYGGLYSGLNLLVGVRSRRGRCAGVGVVFPGKGFSGI